MNHTAIPFFVEKEFVMAIAWMLSAYTSFLKVQRKYKEEEGTL